MNTFIILTTLVTLAITAGQIIEANQIADKAGPRRTQLLNLAKDLSAKISSNNALLNKLQNALNDKNTDLLNATYRGMGFGKRMDSLYKQIEANRKELQDKTTQVNKENIEYQKQADEANYQTANLGISHELNEAMGAKPTWIRQKFAEGKANIENFKNNITQNIDGGIKQ